MCFVFVFCLPLWEYCCALFGRLFCCGKVRECHSSTAHQSSCFSAREPVVLFVAGYVSFVIFIAFVVIVEDPKLGRTIVSACCKQAVLEWRPGHVVDVSLMTLDKRCIRIKGKGAVGIKDSNCRGGIPCDRDHLTVSCTTIVLVRVRGSYTIESCQGCEVHMLE